MYDRMGYVQFFFDLFILLQFKVLFLKVVDLLAYTDVTDVIF